MTDAPHPLETLFGTSAWGWLGPLTAAGLLIGLRTLLPRPLHGKIRIPLGLLGVHLFLVGVRALLAHDSSFGRSSGVIAYFLVMISIVRSSFLLVADSTLGARLAPPMPRIFRDIVQGVLYTAVILATLRVAGVEPGSILTTSAFLTAIIGLSMQDVLGNLFAGLSIQAQTPFDIGDWIQFEADARLVGQVVEINWRSTKVLTNDQIEVIIPNATLAKAPIRNYTKPTPISRRTVEITCSSDVPPRRVHRIILAALAGAPDVLTNPAPSVLLASFGDNGIGYVVHFFTANFPVRTITESAVRARLWYALRRAGIYLPHIAAQALPGTTEPAPLLRGDTHLLEREHFLRGVDVLAVLPAEALRRLAMAVESRLYMEDELVVRQGEPGTELFIVARGEVKVLVGRSGGSTAELTRLGPGRFFGETAFMTGDLRTATVQTATECEFLVVGRDAFQPILAACPEVAERISGLLALRQEQLEQHVAARVARSRADTEERTSLFLNKIRRFFSL